MVKNAAEARALAETAEMQQQTKEALQRIKEQAQDTEDMGAMTLEDLKQQKYATNTILEEADRIDKGLDETKRLQNKLGRWTMNFGRGGGEGVSQKRGQSPKRGTSPKRDESPKRDKPQKRGKSPKRGAAPKPPKASDEPDILQGASGLKEHYADEFDNLAENDEEIDAMLDDTAAILGRLEVLSSNINNEVQQQSDVLEEVATNVEKVNHKQEVANIRARNFLTGKWRKTGDEQ
jgi:hypothetical protein